uniref:Uncharacterized protein n=1 Tax=Klebsiella pneumoniae TaxID=573 RepID=A0A2P1BNC3_KLEPN|nr:hypothetical protein [Klebsiella pneumoniae]
MCRRACQKETESARTSKHVVSAVAAIDAGDIQIFCFADNTGGREDKAESSVLAGPSTYGKMEVFRFALCFWLCIGNN